MLTKEELEARRQAPSKVPCGTCRACCTHDRIVLGPMDDPRAFRWHVEDGYAVLDRKPNGECVYLGEHGCEVHDRAPTICRRFDCRVLYLLTSDESRARRVKENPNMARVYDAGRERLASLEDG